MTRQFRTPLQLAVLVGLIGLGASTAPATIGPIAMPPEPSRDQARPPWKAVAASGTVEAWPAVRIEESWDRVQRGDALEAQTAVRTGRRGRATLIQRASILMLDPESRVSLPVDGASSSETSVVQEYGSVVYEIDGESHAAFRVVTPHLVAGVKGTVFLVSVSETQATVTVREGVVEVMSQRSGALHEVRAGETLLVDSVETVEMELVSRVAPDRAASESPRRETVKLARAEERRIDRALSRLEPNLAAYRYAALRDGGVGLDGLERFLSGNQLRVDLAGSLEGEDSLLGIGSLDASSEELIEDLSNEERQKQIQPPDSDATVTPE